jgi:peptidoglycan/xylan/chitin deacetylase (PgdA/CDA1 family)
MLKELKRSVLRISRATGVESVLRDSRWRAERLVILCYHSLSLRNEHEWNGPLYMRPQDFEGRLEALRRGRWNVLPLGEAVQRLRAGDLPERSVAITFDDGTYDVYREAMPRLQAYGFPATVYLTTYYCDNNLPVFPPVCSYILWSRRGATLKMKTVTGSDDTLPLRTCAEREHALFQVLNFATDQRLDGYGKHELLGRLARAVGFDLDSLCAERLIHIMNPTEVAEASRAGLDIQLHTHRHRTPLDRALFQREIRENRARIAAMTGRDPDHFCYPSGFHRQEFIDWLAAEGVRSATVCESGIASARDNPWLLPRVVDHGGLSLIEFEGWLSGGVSLFPHRRIHVHEVDRSGRGLLPRVTQPA